MAKMNKTFRGDIELVLVPRICAAEKASSRLNCSLFGLAYHEGLLV